MAQPKYELWLTDDKGTRLRSLDDAVWFSATRTINRLGYLEMAVPAAFDDNILRKDQMIQVWRKATGGTLGLWRPYFLLSWRLERQSNRDAITLYGVDCNELLRRRIVAFYAGEAESSYSSEPADDIMKDLVTNAMTDSNPATDAGSRAWDYLTVAPDASAGPSLSKGCSFQPLLTDAGGGVLPALAEASQVAGDEVFFDVVPDAVTTNSMSFIFRTYVNQPGQDLTDRVIFCPEDKNLAYPYIQYDYKAEANYIYAGGQGEQSGRVVQQASDSSRYNLSIWGRSEAFADARNQVRDNSVRETARSALEQMKPKIFAGGEPMDTAGTRFGIDWSFGDKVRMRYRRREFDCVIRSVVLRMNSNGEETIEARLDYES